MNLETVAPRVGHKTLLYSELVTNLAGIQADCWWQQETECLRYDHMALHLYCTHTQGFCGRYLPARHAAQRGSGYFAKIAACVKRGCTNANNIGRKMQPQLW